MKETFKNIASGKLEDFKTSISIDNLKKSLNPHNLKDISLGNWLIIMNLIAFSLRMMTDIGFVLTSMLWFVTGAAGFVYLFWEKAQYRMPLLLLLVIDIIGGINLLINGNHNFLTAGIPVITQVLGILVYDQRKDLSAINVVVGLDILYLTVISAITPRIPNGTFDSRGRAQYSVYISKLTGKNTVSILLIMFLTIHVIHRLQQRRNMNYLYFALSLAAVCFCGGRGGILCISLFSAGVWVIDHRKNKIILWRLGVLVVGFAAACTVLGVWAKLWEAVTYDNARFSIWSNYFSCVDSFGKFIFGAPVDRFEFLMKQKNMHNTFINWHYNFGLIPTVGFLVMVIRGAVHCLETRSFTLLLIFGVVFLRAMTDETSFALMPVWTYIWIQSNSENIYFNNINKIIDEKVEVLRKWAKLSSQHQNTKI